MNTRAIYKALSLIQGAKAVSRGPASAGKFVARRSGIKALIGLFRSVGL